MTLLMDQLKVGPLVARLLVQRGQRDPVKAAAFLSPNLRELHDPMGLPGIEKTAKRLAKAIADKQRIIIYGDYDVDGITASAILFHVLQEAGADVKTYVPHRIEEGYGLNSQAINTLADELQPGPDGGVIISVDCGVTACEPASIAQTRHIDLIITDHHQFDADNLPDAYAIVHPRLPGSTYPFGELCGAGVALKVAWAFARLHCGSERVPTRFRELLLDMLSLAALGTVADIVPLVGENRIITTFGLGRIKQTSIAGLNALIDASRLRDEKVNAYHVGFVLGPRLNACGRMGHANKAVHLLTRAQGSEANEIAHFLTSENDQRKLTERALADTAKAMVVERGYDKNDRRVIVVADKDWHLGVVGIVASRLVETFHRPAIVLSIDAEGKAHGSARSIDKLSIHQAMTACAQYLDTFGGHDMAAGMHLSADKIDAFRDAMTTYVNERLTTDDLLPVMHADILCKASEVNDQAVTQLQRLAPFGRSNPQPMFGVCGLRISQPPKRMGQQGKHLSLVVTDGNVSLRAVGFGLGDLADHLATGSKIDVVCDVKRSTWQGVTRIELMLKSVRPAKDGAGWEEVEPSIETGEENSGEMHDATVTAHADQAS